jgi:hypothetical protein
MAHLVSKTCMFVFYAFGSFIIKSSVQSGFECGLSHEKFKFVSLIQERHCQSKLELSFNFEI